MSFSLFEYAEMLALLTSIFCIKWLWKTPYSLFLPYLLMIVAAEQLGTHFGQNKKYTYNILMYNCTTIVEFAFFFYLFYVNFNSIRLKRMVLFSIFIQVLFSLINLTYIQKLNEFNSYSMLLGTVIIILLVFIYFYNAFENNEPMHLINKPMFWISSGIFLFYLGDFTFNLMYPYLIRNNLNRESRLFGLINNNLIVFEYICFSIALIICSRNRSISKLPL